MIIHAQTRFQSEKEILPTHQGNISPGVRAANWWSKTLKNPKFDNGINSIDAMVDRLLESLNTTNELLPKDNLSLFESILAVEIDMQLSINQNKTVQIKTGYRPDPILFASALDAGLPVNKMSWPWLTEMKITKDDIRVKYGYGSKYELI